MPNATLQQRASLGVSFGPSVVPPEGARVASAMFDFTTGAILNFNQAFDQLGMSMVQTLFVDNRNNASASTFQMVGSNQFIMCPAFTQGFFPVLVMGNQSLTVIGTSAGVVQVPVMILNTFVDPMLWTVGNPVITGAVTVTGVVSAAPQTGVYTNKSASLAAAGVSQALAVANGGRKRLFIQNPSTAAGQGIAAAESVFLNFTSAANVNDGVSFELLAGQSFDTGVGPISTELVNFNATTIAHRIVCKELN